MQWEEVNFKSRTPQQISELKSEMKMEEEDEIRQQENEIELINEINLQTQIDRNNRKNQTKVRKAELQCQRMFIFERKLK